MDDYEFADYLQQLHSANADQAYDALLAACNVEDIPRLIQAFQTESDVQAKVMLVEIIWQQHRPETLTFLAQVLQHDQGAIWQSALDGIVAIGTSEARTMLETEKSRLAARSERDDARRLMWIDEALLQLGQT